MWTCRTSGVPSLLERPENHHMIRWDSAGEHIIVERPEQLALHVLPSVYRQSRFASFSRQLNVSRRSVCCVIISTAALFYCNRWRSFLELSCHVNSLLIDVLVLFFSIPRWLTTKFADLRFHAQG